MKKILFSLLLVLGFVSYGFAQGGALRRVVRQGGEDGVHAKRLQAEFGHGRCEAVAAVNF